MQRHYLFGIYAIITLLLTGCESALEADQQPRLPQVRAQSLQELQTALRYSAPARVISVNDSQISAEVSAVVEAIPVRVGSKVEKDQPLVILNCHDLENRVTQEQATLKSLQARETFVQLQYNRAQKLRAQKSVSEENLNLRRSELDAAQAELRAQQARLAIAKRDRKNCTIRAPFAGVLVERYAQLGQMANAGTAVVRVVDVAQIEVSASVISDDIVTLPNAEQLQFVHNQREYPIRLRAVAAVVDERTRTQEARFEFIDPAPAVGSLGQVVWFDNRPALPAHLLSQRNDRLGLLLAEKNTQDAEAVNVVFYPLPHAIEGQPVWVDLAPATLIITDGRLGLSEGDNVQLLSE